ncbi:MAG: hypothetical protein AAGA75_00625 [Cyanobacteria bacterium P01_E01_bin.6]
MAEFFKDSTVGYEPVFPIQLALARILQAYTNVSDDEVIEALLMDRRWQLAVDLFTRAYITISQGYRLSTIHDLAKFSLGNLSSDR